MMADTHLLAGPSNTRQMTSAACDKPKRTASVREEVQSETAFDRAVTNSLICESRSVCR